MSTNAVIRIEGLKGLEVYKHWDGYPEATLPWLEDFNMRFSKNRGNDPEYKVASLLRDSVLSAKKYGLDPSPYTGWGLYPRGSVSYEYKYILKLDGTVEVIKG